MYQDKGKDSFHKQKLEKDLDMYISFIKTNLTSDLFDIIVKDENYIK
jgi:hypothetical protein